MALLSTRIADPLISPKPTITVAGEATVGISDSTEYPESSYVGTSVSAAVTAGIAALYWEYRSPAMTGVALAREVEAALRDATLLNDTAEILDGSFGWGVVDALQALDPDDDAATDDIASGDTVFDEPLPAEEVAVASVVGGVQISFKKALDDINDAFRYQVTCDDASTYNAIVFPSDSGISEGDNDKAPLFLSADVGELVECTVTPFKDETTTPAYARSAVSAMGAGGEVSPVSVTMTAKGGGAVLEFDASTLDDGQQDIAYEAACTNQGSAIAGWDPNASAQPDTPYVFEAEPAQAIACAVTVVATSNNVEYRSTVTTASATTQSLQSPTVSITPDAEGISVTWTISNIAQSSMATGSLRCTDSETGAVVIDNEAVAYGGGFVAAPAGVALNCALTTTVEINGSEFSTNTTSDVAVTPEETLSSGLPVWLLYVATQPQSVTAVDQSVGTSAAQVTSVRIDSSNSAGQTFTPDVSGELTSVKIYLRSGGATADGVTVDIKAISNGVPSGDVLATETIANGEIAASSGSASAVTVTFATPATLTSGNVYAVLLQTSDAVGYDIWHNGGDYADGTGLAADGGGTNWSDAGFDFTSRRS